MARVGIRYRMGWVVALLGGCVYDSASIDADPFDGLTVLPSYDAGSVEDGSSDGDDAPRAEAQSDAAVSGESRPPSAPQDAGAVAAEDAGTLPSASSPGDGGARDAAVARPDAGSVQRDAGVVIDAGSIDPASYSCTELSYESFGRAFLKKFCNDCHSVQKPALLTLESTALNKDALKQTTVITQRMPLKSGALPTPAQRVQFGVWLDCGPY